VPLGSPEKLVDAILSLLADRRGAHALGSAAASRVRSRYSLEAIADRHADLYRLLMSERGAQTKPAGVLRDPSQVYRP